MRMPFVDTFRIAAILAVIIIHTKPFLQENHDFGIMGYAGLAIDVLTRFAVPFFFITSGFFFWKKIVAAGGATQILVTYASRLLVVLLAWSFLYVFFPSVKEILSLGYTNSIFEHAQNLSPIIILLRGTSPHLWFLSALLFSLSVVSLVYVFNLKRYVLIIGFLFYFYAMATGPYSVVFFSEDSSIRRGMAYGVLFTAIGCYFASERWPKKSGLGISLIILGYFLHSSELVFLWAQYGLYPLEVDYLFGTVLIGTGAFLLVMENNGLTLHDSLPEIGQYTLGIYVSHYMFIKLFIPLDSYYTSVIWELGYPVIVFILSLGLTVFLSRKTALKRLVM